MHLLLRQDDGPRLPVHPRSPDLLQVSRPAEVVPGLSRALLLKTDSQQTRRSTGRNRKQERRNLGRITDLQTLISKFIQDNLEKNFVSIFDKTEAIW